MNDYESWEIAGHTLEYLDDIHQYIVDGICVPSITQCLKFRFGNKYATVDRATLQRASEKGTETHRAIEEWCKEGKESDSPELRNFIFLKRQYKFEIASNEIPVILFKDDEAVCAGRLDLVLRMNDQIGLADIKRTSALDKEYLGYQLNLYRIAYQQCYDKKIEFLRGIHLREDVRKFVQIPINEDMAWDLIQEYLKGEKDGFCG